MSRTIVFFFEQLFRYCSIGILNTLIHWGVFFLVHWVFGVQQSLSNLMGFVVAVFFSFFLNSKYTFRKKSTIKNFISFTFFMGVLSYAIGIASDISGFSPLVTLVAFSAISLFFGFLYSKFIVFKG